MPTYEYVCPNHHAFEVFFKTFSEAEKHESKTLCDCGKLAKRVPSVALQPHLYGNPDGYYKPSATKRFNTKTVSQKTGNRSSVG